MMLHPMILMWLLERCNMLQTIRAYTSKISHLTNDGKTTICGRKLTHFELDYHYAIGDGWTNCRKCNDNSAGFSQAIKEKIERQRQFSEQRERENKERRLAYLRDKSDHEVLANLIKRAILDAFPTEEFPVIQLVAHWESARGSKLEFQVGVHKIRVSGVF